MKTTDNITAYTIYQQIQQGEGVSFFDRLARVHPEYFDYFFEQFVNVEYLNLFGSYISYLPNYYCNPDKTYVLFNNDELADVVKATTLVGFLRKDYHNAQCRNAIMSEIAKLKKKGVFDHAFKFQMYVTQVVKPDMRFYLEKLLETMRGNKGIINPKRYSAKLNDYLPCS